MIHNEENSHEGTPLDSVINRVEGYIQNPKMVTKETLSELLEELQGIKNDVEGHESEEPDMKNNRKGEGIMISIGMRPKKESK